MVHPLRTFRQEKRWSLDRLAELTGESKSKLSRIENGHQDADLAFIRKINELSEGAVTANDFMVAGGENGQAAEPEPAA